jgi:hypothetical protein
MFINNFNFKAEEDSTRGDTLDVQLKRELATGPPFRKVSIEFSYDNGDYLGLTILSSLLISQVDSRPGISAFCDKLFPGDVLCALNNRQIKDLDSFYQALNRLPSYSYQTNHEKSYGTFEH